LLAAAGFACALSALPLAAQDAIFSNGLENAFFAPADDAEAARFLNQATFGATRPDIAAVRNSGFEGYLDQQMSAATTLARPQLEQWARSENLANRSISNSDRVQQWWNNAARAPDQLRQKMAYALGQIIVVSDRNDFLINEPIQMAEWNDIMVRNAFGNYGTLLREVTFSPMMGRYLTHLRNRKYEITPRCRPDGNPSGTPTDCNNDNNAANGFIITPDNSLVNGQPRAPGGYEIGNNGNEPDENYAREVMQLFSIGLVTRELDFYTIVPDPLEPTQPLATYDQQMIRTLTRAFTGMSYDCSGDQVVQGVTISRSCGSGCTGIQCRFTNTSNLFFTDPPRGPDQPDGDDGQLVHPDWYRPMVCYPRYNDNGRDRRRFQLPGQTPTPPTNTTFDAGVVPPAGAPDAFKALTLSGAVLQTQQAFRGADSKETVPNCEASVLADLTDAQRQECVSYCEDNARSAADLLFNHPNTAPMVARQLIQHFVTSNPSGNYVRRVACVFEGSTADPGECATISPNVRGDLRATLRAVLIDAEARQPFAGQFGKVREPMLRLVAIWRHFGAVPADDGNARLIKRWAQNNPEATYLQRPFGAPSVFNFFEPDYSQPGPIAAANLYSPEFQIINENSSMLTANDLYSRICTAYGTSNNCGAAFSQPSQTGTGTNSDRAYFPVAQIDGVGPGTACANQVPGGCTPAQDVALIDELDVRMMGGEMSGAIGNPNTCLDPTNTGMKAVLYNLLRCGLAGNLGQTGATAAVDARRRKVLYLTHLIAISPEYVHQR
jgi:uncharacterized protein (DUF1800 family)